MTYFQFQNPLVVNTINSVLAISHALGTVRRELCSGKLQCLKHQYISYGFCFSITYS
jgi:hypothetical protein